MKKLIYLAGILVLIGAGCNETKPTVSLSQDDGNENELTLAFYNVENLFDTEDDPATADEEFTPTGSKAWTQERYADKIDKLSTVIASLDEELPEIIGLCEVENRKVVEDLISSPKLASANYQIVHRDSPDGRGIDCALVYRSSSIDIVETNFFTAKLPSGDRPNTRLVVYAKGVKGKDTLHVFVNHWPSRGGGQLETEPNRLTIAGLVRSKMDSIRSISPEAKIVLMGDFNDHPNDKSIKEVIQASGKGDWPMYNFMEQLHKSGQGSYNYKGDWGALDQFICSKALMESNHGFSAAEGAARIFKEDFILYTAPDGSQSPNRTYGKDYYGGYSDHLPIVLQLSFIP